MTDGRTTIDVFDTPRVSIGFLNAACIDGFDTAASVFTPSIPHRVEPRTYKPLDSLESGAQSRARRRGRAGQRDGATCCGLVSTPGNVRRIARKQGGDPRALRGSLGEPNSRRERLWVCR